MIQYTDIVKDERSQRPIEGAQVFVYKVPEQDGDEPELATLYAADGVTTVGNPVTTNNLGVYSFWNPAGELVGDVYVGARLRYRSRLFVGGGYSGSAWTAAAAAQAAAGSAPYANTADGLAGTSEGQTFWVDNGDGTGTTFRHDPGPVATELGRFIKDQTVSGAATLFAGGVPTNAALASSSGGEMVGLDAGTAADVLTYLAPEQYGVFHDPTLATDQTATVQAWLDACVTTGKSPFAPRPLTVRIDSAVIYDPTSATRKPTWVDMSNLTLRPTFNGGLRVGNVNARFTEVRFSAPHVVRSGAVSWGADVLASQLSTEAGCLFYNFGKVDLYLGRIAGFTIGAAYHSENFGWAYNQVYGGWLEDNRYNEVGRTIGGTPTGPAFFNENVFFGGFRRENSSSDAFGNAYGTVLTAAVGSYRNANNNLWIKPTYEMGSNATATWRVPILLNGVGTRNRWESIRYEGGIGPAGIAVGTGNASVIGSLNFISELYFGDPVGNSRATWVHANGAYGNVYESPICGTHGWSSGPMRELLSSSGPAASPRLAAPFFLARASSGTPLRAGTVATDMTTNDQGLQVGSSVGVMLEIDTSKTKTFRVGWAALPGFGGRLYVGCFDAAGARLTGTATDAWGTEYYAKFSSGQAVTTLLGGGYQHGSDISGQDIYFTVRDEVKKIWIGPVGGSAPLVIKSLGLVAYPTPTSTTSAFPLNSGAIGFTMPTTDPGKMRLASAKPDTAGIHGFYTAGESAGNAGVSSGQPIGWWCSSGGALAAAWVASTAYSTPGQCVTNDSGKIYALRTAGTSAGSGGPTGTGAAINDGTCVWDYVSAKAVFIAGPNAP